MKKRKPEKKKEENIKSLDVERKKNEVETKEIVRKEERK